MAEWEPMSEISIGGQTKIVIRWVYITEIVVYGILLWNCRIYLVLLQKNSKKIILYFQSKFQYAWFLVLANYLSNYEKLLKLTEIRVVYCDVIEPNCITMSHHRHNIMSCQYDKSWCYCYSGIKKLVKILFTFTQALTCQMLIRILCPRVQNMLSW
jgi:hypothetical protein